MPTRFGAFRGFIRRAAVSSQALLRQARWVEFQVLRCQAVSGTDLARAGIEAGWPAAHH